MQDEFLDRLPAPLLGPCVCSQIRRLARKLSSHYDILLAPEAITITQYSLLANIDRAGSLSHAALAGKVGMERTTLTRNLRPLTRAKWVATATGKDRRQHLLELTAAGKQKLIRSLPFWENAQRQFLDRMGSERHQELRALLVAAESAVTRIFTKEQRDPKLTHLPE